MKKLVPVPNVNDVLNEAILQMKIDGNACDFEIAIAEGFIDGDIQVAPEDLRSARSIIAGLLELAAHLIEPPLPSIESIMRRNY